jgi:hypothetical protein
MQHVPLEDRLTCCCLVNRKLHTAAVAATDSLVLFLAVNAGWQERQYKYASWEDVPPEQRTVIKSFQHADSFLQWLLPYGQHITSLSIMGFPRPLRQLPCHNLLELNLEECSVQLGPAADGSSGVIQGCTKLTCLQLSCNTIDAPAGAVLGSLSNLVHLQHLSVLPKVEMVDHCVGGLSSATLPRLHRLTRISVHSLSVENLLQLGGLTNLQVLQMSAPGDIFVGPSSVPGFALPASLNELVLGSPVEAGILSVVPTELQELYIDCELRGPAEGPGSLLHGIASLDHLTRLVVNSPHGLNWPPPGPAYSALTASSNLQALYMYNTRPPAGVWPYVFPAARILPHLTVLRCFDFAHVGEPDPPSAWGAGDLQHLISCCPNLYVISGIDLQHGQHVCELQELTALTCLDAYYDSSSLADREETFKGLAALTQLERLGIAFGDEQLPVAPFLPLTSLTTLTWLCVNNAALELKIEWDEVCKLADAASLISVVHCNMAHTRVRPDVSMPCPHCVCQLHLKGDPLAGPGQLNPGSSQCQRGGGDDLTQLILQHIGTLPVRVLLTLFDCLPAAGRHES